MRTDYNDAKDLFLISNVADRLSVRNISVSSAAQSVSIVREGSR